MKATLVPRKALLSDIEVGDLVSNKSRTFQVTEIKVRDNKIYLMDGRLPALDGRPFAVVTVYIRKPIEKENNGQQVEKPVRDRVRARRGEGREAGPVSDADADPRSDANGHQANRGKHAVAS